MRRLALVFFALLLPACVSQSSLDGMRIPVEIRASAPVFFVKHQKDDARHLEMVVAGSMEARGLDASLDSEDSADYIVTYIDRWFWDMRMYMIDFRIDVRSASSNLLIATSRSYQTSLAAMGKTYEGIIDEAVAVLLEGIEERMLERKQKNEKRSGRRRRTNR